MGVAQLQDFVSQLGMSLVPLCDRSFRGPLTTRWRILADDVIADFYSLADIDSWIKETARFELGERAAVARFREICLEANSDTLKAIHCWMVKGYQDDLAEQIRIELGLLAADLPALPRHWRQRAAELLDATLKQPFLSLSGRYRQAYATLDAYALERLPNAIAPMKCGVPRL